MHRFLLSITLASLPIVAACGDDPVSYSEPVDLKLSVASGDVSGGNLLDEKNINTESGNPYGAFVASAHDALGAAPGRIVVEGAMVALDPTSTGVANLSEVFAGPLTIGFVMNGSATTYPVATRTEITATGPLPLDVAFDSDTMADADYPDLADGSFKVVLAGGAAGGFATASADADLTVTLTFTAYE